MPCLMRISIRQLSTEVVCKRTTLPTRIPAQYAVVNATRLRSPQSGNGLEELHNLFAIQNHRQPLVKDLRIGSKHS
jgi:hypothetical protein